MGTSPYSSIVVIVGFLCRRVAQFLYVCCLLYVASLQMIVGAKGQFGIALVKSFDKKAFVRVWKRGKSRDAECSIPSMVKPCEEFGLKRQQQAHEVPLLY
jgi:hypothetical protein